MRVKWNYIKEGSYYAKEMVNRFLCFCYFCGSVVALIHANKGKKYDIKAFSNLNSKQKDDMQEVDATEKNAMKL